MVTRSRARRGRPVLFADAFLVRWTKQQSDWISAEAQARNIPLAEVVRQCVQARMDAK